jgi:uncharacterized protein
MCPRCKSHYWNVPKIRPVREGFGLGIEEILEPHRAEILKLASRFGARNIRVFGSVRRREATRESDVDLLVDWDSKASVLDTAGFRLALQELLGRGVDTAQGDFLHWAMKPQILYEAIPL